MAQQTHASLTRAGASPMTPESARAVLTDYIRTKKLNPQVMSAVASTTGSIAAQVKEYGSLNNVPAHTVGNVRNDMYLVSEAIRFLQKDPGVKLDASAKKNLTSLQQGLGAATRFIRCG